MGKTITQKSTFLNIFIELENDYASEHEDVEGSDDDDMDMNQIIGKLTAIAVVQDKQRKSKAKSAKKV